MRSRVFRGALVFLMGFISFAFLPYVYYYLIDNEIAVLYELGIAEEQILRYAQNDSVEEVSELGVDFSELGVRSEELSELGVRNEELGVTEGQILHYAQNDKLTENNSPMGRGGTEGDGVVLRGGAEQSIAVQDEVDVADSEPRKVAYLTFDDGPSRAVTPGILDVLAKEDIKATFFVLPHRNVDDLFQRIIDEGHTLGNHSFTHNYTRLYRTTTDDFIDDIARMQIFLLEKFDYEATIFRFPGGSMSWGREAIARRKEILEEMGLLYYDWNIDSRDSHPHQTDRSAATLSTHVLDSAQDRDVIIVLMHDTGGKQSTLEALPRIISGLREQGFVFEAL